MDRPEQMYLTIPCAIMITRRSFIIISSSLFYDHCNLTWDFKFRGNTIPIDAHPSNV